MEFYLGRREKRGGEKLLREISIRVFIDLLKPERIHR
jgi:hypothetical protein